jgi:hypothetical protein
MRDPKSRFTELFFCGAVVIIVGMFLMWYPSSVIGGLKQSLQFTSSYEESNSIIRSIAYWINEEAVFFTPFSLILMVSGAFVLLYSMIYIAIHKDDKLQAVQSRLP